ncbi:MAG: spore coat protein CotJB [Clostridia bacterium]|nr:spore coat protein CotJB [Clostridia bacterium]
MMNLALSRERLMRQIQIYSFAVYDALLYLDAYPDSKSALNFYNQSKRAEERAIAEYEARYGKIRLSGEEKSWQWTDGPWPWQNEEAK